MYWQVYLHKTVLSAEFLLAKIIERARALINNGEKLLVLSSMKYFFESTIHKENISEYDFLTAFSKLDDYDVLSCIKVWADSDDQVFQSLVKC